MATELNCKVKRVHLDRESLQGIVFKHPLGGDFDTVITKKCSGKCNESSLLGSPFIVCTTCNKTV